MKELLKTNIKREQGKLYFCKTSNDGCLVIYEADMVHKGKGKKKK